MAEIKIVDSFGLTVDVEIREGSPLENYLRGLPRLLFRGNFGDLAGLPLHELDDSIRAATVGFTVEQPIEFGVDGVEMVVEAGATITLDVFLPGDEIVFGGDTSARPIETDDGQRCLEFGFKAQFSSDIEGIRAATFGLRGGSSLWVRNFRFFEADTGFGEAIRRTLGDFAVIRDVDDLRKLEPGALVAVDGRGVLEFSGEADLLAVSNPLTSVDLPTVGGLQLTSGASVNVGASFEVAGDYQMRAHRLEGDSVELGFYRQRASSFNVTARAAAALGAEVGDFDLTERLLGAMSGDLEVEGLEEVGLDAAKKEAIEAAIRGGIERSLELSLNFELGRKRASEAAFLCEVDFASLGDGGRAALRGALAGNLSGLGPTTDSSAGVEVKRSVFRRIRSDRHALRINVFNFYNLFSVAELVSESEVMFSPATGEIVFSDTTSASRIRGEAAGIANAKKLRELMAEFFFLTAVYRSVDGVVTPPQLESAHSYLEFHERTNWQTMKDNLDIAEAIELIDRRRKSELLGDRGGEFGSSLFLAESSFDDDACLRLFLTPDGTARERGEYESIGREAFGRLLQPDDPDKEQFRRLLVEADNFERMKEAAPNFRQLFGDLSPRQLAILAGDYFTIVWWAKSMARAANALEEINARVRASDGASPNDEEFRELREGLARLLESVARDSDARFGDPWGFVAMDLAASGRSAARIVVNSTELTFREQRVLEE